MRVIVGTKNPSKLFSVRGAIEKLFPEHPSSTAPPTCRVTVCSIAGTASEPVLGDVIRVITEPPAGTPVIHEIIGVEVESAVAAQPMSATETLQGARARARRALAILPSADFAFGIEGGIEIVPDAALSDDDTIPSPERYLESGYIFVIRGSDGKTGLGTSARFEIAPHVMARLHAGEELCEVLDDISGEDDVRSNQGMMGMITNGTLPRGACYEHGVIFALAPFVSPQQYWSQEASDKVSKKVQAKLQSQQ